LKADRVGIEVGLEGCQYLAAIKLSGFAVVPISFPGERTLDWGNVSRTREGYVCSQMREL